MLLGALKMVKWPVIGRQTEDDFLDFWGFKLGRTL